MFYNIEKSLEQFADNQILQGMSNQQFTITASNNLSNFLSDVLDNMEEQLNPSPGSGQGKMDMQLQDIIMRQEELNKMMEEGLKKAKEGKDGKPEDKNGEKDGEKGKDKNGQNGMEGEGDGEQDSMNGLLYEIYQEQEKLRQALEDQLTKNGDKGSGSDLLRKMEEVEMELLNKGFTNQTLEKMMELEHQLLKLDNAAFQQGEDNKRESKSNEDTFDNNSVNQIPRAKQYFKNSEIFNRQALPLQQTYKVKVQDYFRRKDD